MYGSICFVGLDNYPVMNPAIKGYIGGESIQQTLLAKAFCELNYDVSMVVKDYGQPSFEVIDNIRLFKTFGKNAGIPVFRFFHPRLTSVVDVLRNINADIYYQSGAGVFTGVVAWFCKRNGKRFIFRSASDADFMNGQQIIRYWRDKKLYEYGLRRADIIAVQGIKQKELLRKNYALDGSVVNMTVEVPKSVIGGSRDIDVLWVSNFRPLKRAEMFVRVARMLLHRRFVMIGGPCPGSESYYQEIREKAEHLNNLDVLGPIPYSQIGGYFERAKVFVNTSEVEGFPNTFLQAWGRGVPTVSFFDPDDLIIRQRLGFVPKGIDEMAEHLERLLCKGEISGDIGVRAREFVNEEYSPINAARAYINLLNRLYS